MSVDLRALSFQYAAGQHPVLNGIDLQIAEGEFVVLAGPSGCGKTTITRIINGLIPHFHAGELTGEARVCGVDPSAQPMWKTAGDVASVFQNPRSQFFTTDPHSEIAFGSENLGVPAETTSERVHQAIEEFQLQELANRSIFALSGGEKQRIACASARAMRPAVYVLDEPSANLDEVSTRALMQSMSRWKAAGATVVVAEHRLGYLRSLMDRLILLDGGRIVGEYRPSQMTDAFYEDRELRYRDKLDPGSSPMASPEPSLLISDLRYTYARRIVPGASPDRQLPALNLQQLRIPKGKITAVIGPNGAGKTTLARWMAGLTRVRKGTFSDEGQIKSRRWRRQNVFLVQQDVNHQLVSESVADEVDISAALGGHSGQSKSARVRTIIEQMDLDSVAEQHPLALSGGQQQRLAIATALASERKIVILDEPTSGLDLGHMHDVARAPQELTRQGRTVIVITHDAELVEACAEHVVCLEEGQAILPPGSPAQDPHVP